MMFQTQGQESCRKQGYSNKTYCLFRFIVVNVAFLSHKKGSNISIGRENQAKVRGGAGAAPSVHRKASHSYNTKVVQSHVA